MGKRKKSKNGNSRMSVEFSGSSHRVSFNLFENWHCGRKEGRKNRAKEGREERSNGAKQRRRNKKVKQMEYQMETLMQVSDVETQNWVAAKGETAGQTRRQTSVIIDTQEKY